MIITLEEAQKYNPDCTQLKLDGLEAFIREYTSNNFQLTKIRIKGNLSFKDDEISGVANFLGFRVGDTIQVSKTVYNDGLYTIKELKQDEGIIVLNQDDLIEISTTKGYITKVEYPATIQQGVIDLLKFDEAQKEQIGIKSETISRWSRTYEKPSDSQNKAGYPSYKIAFLDEYIKMDWGT